MTVGRVPFHVRYTTVFDETGKPLKAYGSATMVNPYVNIFVTTEKNFNDPRIKQLEKVYRSEENKKFILDHFKGSILSAW